jgi:hypothetical protein
MSHAVRGFVSQEGQAFAVYLAGYTEQHTPQIGTVLVSIGAWADGSTPADRLAVVMKVRVIDGAPQVMVVGPEGCPWTDVGVFGRILSREEALARPDIKEYFHVIDHVIEVDERFMKGFQEPPPRRPSPPTARKIKRKRS